MTGRIEQAGTTVVVVSFMGLRMGTRMRRVSGLGHRAGKRKRKPHDHCQGNGNGCETLNVPAVARSSLHVLDPTHRGLPSQPLASSAFSHAARRYHLAAAAAGERGVAASW